MLSNANVSPHRRDLLVWDLHPSGQFLVKTFYENVCIDAGMHHPMAIVWQMVGPPRPKACLWLVGLGKILTRDALSRRGLQLDASCPFCNNMAEIASHLFLHCSWVAAVWEDLGWYLGVHSDTTLDIAEFVLQWLATPMQGLGKDVWELSLLAVIWIIWKTRNLKVFENELKEHSFVFDWVLQLPSGSVFDMVLRVINRTGRLYKLDKVDRGQWDILPSYDGKVVLLQGIPRNALPEDVERLLSGCNFDASNIQIFMRAAFPDPIRIGLVPFLSQSEAMNAVRMKNRGFCLNNQITIRVLQ